MAVTFTSHGYDTLPGQGLSETVWEEMHPQIGTSMGVRNPGDWKVTGVSGADRTVSIAAGRGWDHGIIDKTVENDTIQLDPVAGPTGTVRWDLIACRRDPTPSAGKSEFVKVNGGANPVIPGGRLSGPGIRDQPLALVPVIAGQTQPGTIIDLRTWSGDSGGLIANHDLVLSFLNEPGTQIHINGKDWIRKIGANDLPEWTTPSKAPFRHWFAVSTMALNGEGGAWTVQFPPNYFTKPPLVFLTHQSNVGVGYQLYNVEAQTTTTSARIGAFWAGNTNGYTVRVGIYAVQASDGFAAGLVS